MIPAYSPDTLTFCLLSFEGPDRYAQAGGLGVRVTHLAETLARRGFPTHHLFVGDPAAPGQETIVDGRLTLLRWCQWISVYHLRLFMPQTFLRPFYAGADAVLAASGHEPFGLVGLEAMAAGGLVFTGATGEEYTLGGQGAIVLDTDRPEEVVLRLLGLRAQPDRAQAIRQTARGQAANFTWERVTDILLDKVEYVARGKEFSG